MTKERYNKWIDILSRKMEKRRLVVEIIDMLGKFCGVIIILLIISDICSSNIAIALTISKCVVCIMDDIRTFSRFT